MLCVECSFQWYHCSRRELITLISSLITWTRVWKGRLKALTCTVAVASENPPCVLLYLFLRHSLSSCQSAILLPYIPPAKYGCFSSKDPYFKVVKVCVFTLS